MFVFVVSLSANAQDTETEKVMIKYDPLFWKDQLRLTPSQSIKIKEINIEYYEKLKMVYSNQENQQVMREKVDWFNEQRSDRIWSTFHTRQKRKWAKLWNESSDKNG